MFAAALGILTLSATAALNVRLPSPSRAAVHSAVSARTLVAPSMIALPDASSIPQEAAQFVSTHLPLHLLASTASPQEITPVLIGQMGVITAMLAAGFALDKQGVYEPEEPDAEPGSIDIYRNSPLRYMGYANECGEAFRPLVDVSIVYLTYVGAITYILADTVDKGAKGAKVESESVLRGVIGATDTFLWQMLASVR
ncbi:hypothetical protein AB1Y20_008422 [Prymnesium parvum]|uniref:Mitochondrial fission process protein 1 n=1 Tax=Prymnesium parvum TaxID=97485 RepID=A0AB34IUG9_PRYPA